MIYIQKYVGCHMTGDQNQSKWTRQTRFDI